MGEEEHLSFLPVSWRSQIHTWAELRRSSHRTQHGRETQIFTLEFTQYWLYQSTKNSLFIPSALRYIYICKFPLKLRKSFKFKFLWKQEPSFSPPGSLLWEALTLLPLYSLQVSSQKTSSTSHHLTKLKGKHQTNVHSSYQLELKSSCLGQQSGRCYVASMPDSSPLRTPRGKENSNPEWQPWSPALRRAKKNSYAESNGIAFAGFSPWWSTPGMEYQQNWERWAQAGISLITETITLALLRSSNSLFVSL